MCVTILLCTIIIFMKVTFEVSSMTDTLVYAYSIMCRLCVCVCVVCVCVVCVCVCGVCVWGVCVCGVCCVCVCV
jgi:hypothetical protein